MSIHKRGFTLIELLVVLALIAFLSTVSVLALGSARESSRDSKRLSDLKQLQGSLEWYYTNVGSYPVAPTGVALGIDANGTSCLDKDGGFEAKADCDMNSDDTYMGIVPVDPGSYNYIYNSVDGASYTVVATLEGQINNLGPGNITLSPSGIQ
ncbi:prepilin-type N-terminal cleavage/methylation domain-containing protein [Patescibacteria group bacterium]|nr:prepilin-type N-terminal cleavage/methylation domain-containing protein [Patescibacteria group bacterium]MBU1721788.1 prepilin-type N-terminal cleavage/methylation domain-containing protein [Patescibacteria group bacterium]MBU1901373.1 prepilin-type N-terminal cleavage/methylation domain-containing protein [Patescibacteria group bacterium]